MIVRELCQAIDKELCLGFVTVSVIMFQLSDLSLVAVNLSLHTLNLFLVMVNLLLVVLPQSS